MTTQRPIMLGVVGDSAAGKSTLTTGIIKLFGPERVTAVCLDDYHKYDRKQRAELGITALHPECNHIDVMVEHVHALRRGEPITKPIYEHSDGTIKGTETVYPREVVMVQGLHTLFNRELREAFDVAIFLDPDTDLRLQWKIKRDSTKRGYTQKQVLQQIEQRWPDVRDFILPQRQHANMIIRFYPVEDYCETMDDAHLNVHIMLGPTLPRLDLRDVLEVARDGHLPALRELRRTYAGREFDIIAIDGNITPEKTIELENVIWDHMPQNRHLRPDQIGTFIDRTEKRHSDPLALTQLLVTYYLIEVGEKRVGVMPAMAMERP